MLIKEALKAHEDSLILLSFILRKDKAWVLSNQDRNLTNKQFNNLTKLVKKREQHWPVAYLVGHKEFYGLEFKVTPDTLIPRPDSELLVELALDRVKSRELRVKNIFDIGTGSGNLIISIAKNLSRRKINYIATDISEKALKVARQNAKTHKVQSKIKFLNGNLLKPLISDKRLEIRDSIIVANLPYLSTKQLNNLTIKREPKTALAAGPDGLKYYKMLFLQVSKLLTQNSTLLIEFDPRQKKSLENLAKKYFPKTKKKFHKDLSGKWRVLEVIKALD